MEITKFDLANIKRTRATSNGILKKMERVREKINSLTDEYNDYLRIFNSMESYVMEKFGYNSHQLLENDFYKTLTGETSAQTPQSVEETSEEASEPVTGSSEMALDETNPFA